MDGLKKQCSRIFTMGKLKLVKWIAAEFQKEYCAVPGIGEEMTNGRKLETRNWKASEKRP